MDSGSEKGVPSHEAMYSRTANGNRTKTQRRANNVPLCSQRSGQCSLTSGKSLTANVQRIENEAKTLVSANQRLTRGRVAAQGANDWRQSKVWAGSKAMIRA
ncbi:hypothetical protein Tco_1510591, partial [Tanacetum coccineum]